jgi:predicted TIM-barrel fold metal-dependent hydrolase
MTKKVRPSTNSTDENNQSPASAAASAKPANAPVPRRNFLQFSLAAGILSSGPALGLGQSSPRGQSPHRERASKVIDIHAHYFPTEYLDLLDRFGGTPAGTTPLSRDCFAGKAPGDLEYRFRVLDEAGIDVQILSVPPQLPYFANQSNGVEAARLANDLCAELARQYPERFKVFACFPLPHIDASLKELVRGLDELGMVGAAVGTYVRDKSIADSAFDPIFAELNRREAVLFVHPTAPAGCSACLNDTGLTWPVGAPFEDTICLLQMIRAGIPTRYPKMRIIIPHLGGTLPFLWRRVDHQAAMFMPKGAEKPSVLAKSFWVDTVNGHPSALRDTCDCFGPDHVLMGTDYPYWRTQMKLCVDYIKEVGLSTVDVAGILGNTAQKLLAPALGRRTGKIMT